MRFDDDAQAHRLNRTTMLPTIKRIFMIMVSLPLISYSTPIIAPTRPARCVPAMPLARFHPIIAEWFRARFGSPTDVQAQSWPAIAPGKDVLIAAPTGSGKTLAAFLSCLDALFKQALAGGLEDRTQVVYVSPLKALSNDIQKNLHEPLAEISERAQAAGLPRPEIRVAVRTGDTPGPARQQLVRRPPR